MSTPPSRCPSSKRFASTLTPLLICHLCFSTHSHTPRSPQLILDASLLWHFEYLSPFRKLFQSPTVCLLDSDGQPTGAVDVAGLTELVRLLLSKLTVYRREKAARLAQLAKDRQRANEGRMAGGAEEPPAEEDSDDGDDDASVVSAGGNTAEEPPVTMDDIETFLRSVPLRNTTRFTFTDVCFSTTVISISC